MPERIGNRYESTYPYDSFRAKDCSIVIGCGNDKLFRALTNLMGQPELAADPRFCSNPLRVQNHAALKRYLEDWLVDWEGERAVEAILAAGVPAAPINTIDKVVSDPHIAGAREMFVEVEHPVAGRTRLTGAQIKFSDSASGIRSPSPTLGQHTSEVLGELLGIGADELSKLSEIGTI